MQKILISHRVEDYGKWKTSFENATTMRKESGERSYQLFRTHEDPNNLVLLFEWDNLENAQKFLDSEELRETMQQAGVTGKPEISFIDDIENGTL